MAKQKNPPVVVDPKVIDASPTKDLFISMLVRDITLKDAIGDLVDNCVDGARSLMKGRSYNGLVVDIIANQDKFEIKDNCGGFTVEVARKYAFRFGRPSDFITTKRSVGQFGIGMKRAIFKLGTYIEIESTTKKTYFKLCINVKDWRSVENGWDFKFEDGYYEDGNNPKEHWGTKISVTQLTDDAKQQFALTDFIKDLKKEIQKEHLFNIHKGLSIKINKDELSSTELKLKESKDIIPAIRTFEFEHDNNEKVLVKLMVGLGSDNLKEGGWYIFCNDRLIVGPEQTHISGWTGRGSGGVASYHDQFSEFRGYAFFSADNSSLLPWNTTKTNLDLDSPLYITIRTEMIDMMRAVIKCLNRMKKEREDENPEDNRPLSNAVAVAKEVVIDKLKTNIMKNVFVYPNVVPSKKSDDIAINFKVSRSHFEEVKEHLNATSRREVGELVFDYFYNNEIDY